MKRLLKLSNIVKYLKQNKIETIPANYITNYQYFEWEDKKYILNYKNDLQQIYNIINNKKFIFFFYFFKVVNKANINRINKLLSLMNK